jgi:hypothetical protein
VNKKRGCFQFQSKFLRGGKGVQKASRISRKTKGGTLSLILEVYYASAIVNLVFLRRPAVDFGAGAAH